MAAIRRLYVGLRVRYKYYRKHSRFGLAWKGTYQAPIAIEVGPQVYSVQQ